MIQIRGIIAAVSILFALATGVHADPKIDCEQVVLFLGFPIDEYGFEEAGFFSKEKHHFGSVTCYIDVYEQVHSVTRLGTIIAEDGYFGEETIRIRSEIERLAYEEIELARSLRDKLIKETKASFNTTRATLLENRDAELAMLRQSNDPISSVNANSAPSNETPSPNEDIKSPEVDQLASDVEQHVESKEYWVIADQLTRRTCPSTICGSVGWFLDGQVVNIFEDNGQWARVSDYYDASCINGASQYVDKGNKLCVAENGINDGEMAEWVSMKFLSSDKPEKPIASDESWDHLVVGSDNYRKYQSEFVDAAKNLILGGRCTKNDFNENGGWTKSASRGSQPIYFIYCGGFTVSNRIYLDASSGKIFK